MSMGCDTLSLQLSLVTTILFAFEMFNTGILMLIVNANLTEQGLPQFLGTGNIADFNTRWFT